MGAFIAVGALLVAPLGARGADPSCSWPTYGRDAGLSFSQTVGCSDITPLNVSSMHLKWFVPATDSVTASPTVVDGTVYVGDWTGRFSAIDAETGAEEWHFIVDDPNDVAFGRIVSSAAVADVGGTQVVVFGGGATLYVLNAATGTELTRVCVDPRADEAVRCQGSSADIEIESSPKILTIDGETWIVVGMDVHNRSNVGRTGVLAFRLDDDPWGLATVWKFDPENLSTYTGLDALTTGAGTGDGCGGVWSSPAIDVAGDMVFFGTSSCSDDAPDSGESMYAITLRSGEFVWREAPVTDALGEPHKRLDDDFGASPNLLPGGLVGFGGKNGWYYARDRGTGAPGWAQDARAGEAGHITTDFAVGGMIGTAAVGEVFDEPAIFATTALSTPIDRPFDEGDPSRWVDTTLAEDPGRMLSLHAMSARTGEILWRQPLSRQAYGAPTYANGVLFVPSTFDLTVKAFDADTGLLLWESPLLGASSSTPVVVGDTIYLGSGTRTTDVEYKAFGGDAIGEALGSPSPLSPLSGIWAFEIVDL